MNDSGTHRLGSERAVDECHNVCIQPYVRTVVERAVWANDGAYVVKKKKTCELIL